MLFVKEGKMPMPRRQKRRNGRKQVNAQSQDQALTISLAVQIFNSRFALPSSISSFSESGQSRASIFSTAFQSPKVKG
jgi:hypothetical protein